MDAAQIGMTAAFGSIVVYLSTVDAKGIHVELRDDEAQWLVDHVKNVQSAETVHGMITVRLYALDGIEIALNDIKEEIENALEMCRKARAIELMGEIIELENYLVTENVIGVVVGGTVAEDILSAGADLEEACKKHQEAMDAANATVAFDHVRGR